MIGLTQQEQVEFERIKDEMWDYGYETAKEEFGWHSGSKPPKEDGEYITIMSNSLGEHGETCTNDFSNGEWNYTGYDWEPREVLWWIRKPKKE